MFKSKLLQTVTIMLSLFAVAACGQKGPLYLADETPPANQQTDVDTAPENDQKQEK